MRLGWWIGVAMLFGSGSAQAATCRLGAAGTTVPVAIEGTGRSMLVHVPAGRSAARLPLVFVFHGSTGKGRDILDQSKLEATADRHGFLLAAPDGGIPAEKGFVWNIPGVPTVTGKIPGPDDADDVAFVQTAIDQLAAKGCVDRARIYATGYSGGGRMTSWLGCVAADRFAAIAPVVGLRAGNPRKDLPRVPDPATCTPARPIPVLAFAGDADTTNPIQGGGAGYWQYTMHTALVRWADLNGCRVGPVEREVSADVQEERFSRCSGGADVAGRVKHGAGHVWVADNEAMWDFFAKYRR
ncbi:alpha/beta hydrolase family esterase [Sphingomonas sp. 22176]|uniref:alpha/beta hydrolase family esterase n=1 Tax=Sphingomonas sp. 22176 TaxID=3453884 RepID=UPI003F838E62